MAAKGKKKERSMPVYDSIRKPTAPPSRKFEDHAAAEKHLPSQRKSKHKKPPKAEE